MECKTHGKGKLMDGTRIAREFDDLVATYKQWRKPLAEYREENSPPLEEFEEDGVKFWRPVNLDPTEHWNRFEGGYAAFERKEKELEASLLEQWDPHAQVQRLMDRLAPVYLASPPAERELLRTLVADRPALCPLILIYASRTADRLASRSDVATLRNGLAAISIENSTNDPRDTIVALGELCGRAEELRMNWKPHCRSVAALSSTEQVNGGWLGRSWDQRGMASVARLLLDYGERSWWQFWK
ncbi:MAG: hypothetical protein HRU14_05545 [Planctomycetes bacterium]|nr:hypothetical protein [Planctomycetota bacterium]